jgi:hypothetical protein
LSTPCRPAAKLSEELDATRLYYGSEDERAEKQKKVDAATKLHTLATVESRARRATFNASESGKDNAFGDRELVEEVTSGRIDVDALPATLLPEPMQAMAPVEVKAEIAKKAEQRQELQQKIDDLAEARSAYLRDKVEAEGGAEDSLDAKLYRSIKEQAVGSGMRYEAAAPAY